MIWVRWGYVVGMNPSPTECGEGEAARTDGRRGCPMSTVNGPALELRQAITEVYTADDPPPGIERANALVLALKRSPRAETLRRARDLLSVVELRARLLRLRAAAESAGAATRALVVHGLIGHADAELLGGEGDAGWRAAALDLVEPDGVEVDPVDPVTARRLLALARGQGWDGWGRGGKGAGDGRS